MKLSLSIEGGLAHFPGLARPSTLDPALLPPDEREQLERLVVAADLDTAQERVAPPSTRGADRRLYVISVEDGESTTSLRIPEPIQDPALRALVDYLRSHRP